MHIPANTREPHVNSIARPASFRLNWTFVLAGSAFLATAIAAICFMPMWEGALWVPALSLAAAGMVCMGVLVWRHPMAMPTDAPEASETTLSQNAPLTQFDWFGVGAGIAMLGTVTALQFAPQVPERLQLALIAGGMGAFIWGAAGLRPDHFVNLLRAWASVPRWVSYSLLATFFGALAVRLWRLESGLRVLVDEMQNIVPAVRMWEANFPLFQQIYYPDYPYPYIYPYLQQAGSAVFGYSLFTLRVPNAIYGALSVFAIYWLVKLLFENRQLAVMSAVALAALPMHMQFSRIGIMNLYDPTLAMLAFAFAIRGVRYGLRRDWVLAGTMLGFTHYVYEGGRLLHTPLISLWLFILVIWLWRQAEPMRVARGLALAVTVSLVLAAPIYITWVGMDGEVFGRLSSQNLTRVETPSGFDAPEETDYRLQQMVTNLVDSFALYVTKLDEWMFYGGTQPMIPTFLQPFFLLGLVASLVHRRRWGYTVLPALWLLVTATLLGLFIWNPLHVARHTVAMPAIAIAIALGVWWLARLCFPVARTQLTAAWTVLLCLVMAQVIYYFAFHLPVFNNQARWVRGYADPDDAMLRAADLPNNTEVYVITRTELFPRWHPKYFLLYITHGDVPVIHVWLQSWLRDDILTDLTPGNNHAFFVEASNSELIDEIMSLHPTMIPSFSDDPYLSPTMQFVMLYLPADELLPPPQAVSTAEDGVTVIDGD